MRKAIRNPILGLHARQLRKDITFEEFRLWKILRNRKLGEWKFRRQYVIEPYIADFCCIPVKLIVEIDGETHDTRHSQDQQRDQFLSEIGYTILRFWNEEMKYEESRIVESIVNVAKHVMECREVVPVISIGRIVVSKAKTSQRAMPPLTPNPSPRSGERGARENQ
ncbi:hypothetical protein BH11PLA2_BH11PLA2_42760 [soil metagenome]